MTLIAKLAWCSPKQDLVQLRIACLIRPFDRSVWTDLSLPCRVDALGRIHIGNFCQDRIGFFLEQVYRKMFFVVVVSPLLNLMRILLKNSFLHHYFGIRRDGFCSRDMLLSVLLLTLSSLPSLLQNMLHSASKDAPIPATSTTPSSSVPKQKHAEV